jgi:hypothetical protein
MKPHSNDHGLCSAIESTTCLFYSQWEVSVGAVSFKPVGEFTFGTAAKDQAPAPDPVCYYHVRPKIPTLN